MSCATTIDLLSCTGTCDASGQPTARTFGPGADENSQRGNRMEIGANPAVSETGGDEDVFAADGVCRKSNANNLINGIDTNMSSSDRKDRSGNSPQKEHSNTTKLPRVMPKAPTSAEFQKQQLLDKEERTQYHLDKLGIDQMSEFERIFSDLKERDVNTIERLATNRMREQEMDTHYMDLWGKKKFDIKSFGFKFDLVIMIIVVLNAVEIAHSTNVAANGGSTDGPPYSIFGHLLCIIFILEFILRFRILGWLYFKRVYFVLDFILVILALVDTWILGALTSLNGRALSVARIFRLLRLVRLIKLAKTFRSVWLLVIGFCHSIQVLCGAMLLLGLVVFASAVYLTQKLAELDEDLIQVWMEDGFDRDEKFGSVEAAMWTLFGCVVDGCYDDIFTRLMHEDKIDGVFALIFLFTTFFGLMNILVGIFCETCLDTARKELSMAELVVETRQKVELHSLREIWVTADDDGDGLINENDIWRSLEEPQSMIAFEDLELHDLQGRELFISLDVNKSGHVNMEEFLSGMLKLNRTGMNINSVFLMVQRIERMNEMRDERISQLLENQSMLGANQADLQNNQVRISDDVARCTYDIHRCLQSVHEMTQALAGVSVDPGLQAASNLLKRSEPQSKAHIGLPPVAEVEHEEPKKPLNLAKRSSKIVQFAA